MYVSMICIFKFTIMNKKKLQIKKKKKKKNKRPMIHNCLQLIHIIIDKAKKMYGCPDRSC